MQLPTNFDLKKTLSIVGALSISGGMILAAYAFSGPSFFTTQQVNAEDTKKLLEAYAAKDSDSDGLPDWKEALYGTNPQDAHSVDKALTDGEAITKGLVKPKFESAPIATSTVDVRSIPGVTASSSTLTDQFAHELFAQYIKNTGTSQPTSAEVASFVTGAVGQLNDMYVSPAGYMLSDLRVAGSGVPAAVTYIGSAQNVFFSNVPSNPKDETDYFYDAVTKNDATAIAKVAKIGAWYTATGKAYAKITVPTELSGMHLRLTNALIQIGSVVSDMSLINTDPLRTLLAVGHYDAARKELLDSVAALHATLAAENVSVEAGAPGYRFVQMLQKWSPLQ